MKKILTLTGLCLAVLLCKSQIAIDPLLFGQNYWFANHNQTSSSYRPSLSSTSLPNVWTDVKNSGVRLV